MPPLQQPTYAFLGHFKSLLFRVIPGFMSVPVDLANQLIVVVRITVRRLWTRTILHHSNVSLQKTDLSSLFFLEQQLWGSVVFLYILRVNLTAVGNTSLFEFCCLN